MSIDVQIVAPAEDIASGLGLEMDDWLFSRFEDFDHRYGYIELSERDVEELERLFSDNPVGEMLLRKLTALKVSGHAPYVIELMIG